MTAYLSSEWQYCFQRRSAKFCTPPSAAGS